MSEETNQQVLESNASLAEAIGKLADALTKSSKLGAQSKSLVDLIGELNEKVDKIGKQVATGVKEGISGVSGASSFVTTDKEGRLEEIYEKDQVIREALRILSEKERNFEKSGEKEKLQDVETATKSRLSQVEGFFSRYIPSSIQGILSFLGGKEILESINKSVIDSITGMFAGKEKEKADDLKRAREQIYKDRDEQENKRRESDETDENRKKAYETYWSGDIIPESNLNNTGESVKTDMSIVPVNREDSLGGKNKKSVNNVENEGSSEAVTKDNAILSEEASEIKVSIVDIKPEVLNSLAAAIKDALTEKRSLTSENDTSTNKGERTPSPLSDIETTQQKIPQSLEIPSKDEEQEVASYTDLLKNITPTKPKEEQKKENKSSGGIGSKALGGAVSAVGNVVTKGVLKKVIPWMGAIGANLLLGGPENPAADAASVFVKKALEDEEDGILFAKGGDVKGDKPIIVGEKGPEVFVPNANGTIVPNDKIKDTNSVAATPAIEKLTSLFSSTSTDKQTTVTALPSEELKTISNVTNINNDSNMLLSEVNKTLLDISSKLENNLKNPTNQTATPSTAGIMSNSNTNNSSSINITTNSSPITNSRIITDTMLYRRRALA
jgi:hypothetical protein